jgi:hypothetical protein
VWAECYDANNERYYEASIIEFDGYYNGCPHVTQRPMTSEEIVEYNMLTPPQIPRPRPGDGGNPAPPGTDTIA